MRTYLIVFALAVAAPANSQTLSVEELRAKIDERVSGMNEFQQLLNDPDPARSMAAMEIMMSSGDPALERMAREFGIFSADPVIRRAAIDAWLSGEPVIGVTFDGQATENTNFGTFVKRAGGSVRADKSGYVSLKVGKYDDKLDCYLYSDSKICSFRVSDAGISYNFNRAWAEMQLNDDGVLEGVISFSGVKEPIPVQIAVSD